MTLTPRFALRATIILWTVLAALPAAAATRVTTVRTEYLSNPIGIDAANPRFSWVLESSVRGDLQTAYQILVSSSSKALALGQGDVWDSGKVPSPENAQVVYAGAPLQSHQRYHVSVRVWDRKGNIVRGEPAFFQMGVLDPSLWQAQWIGLTPSGNGERLALAAARWVWLPQVKAGPKITRIGFRKTFNIPDVGQVVSAELLVVGNDLRTPFHSESRHLLWVNDKGMRSWISPVSDPRRWNVLPALKSGDNTIAIASPYAPDQALVAAVIVAFRDGRQQIFNTDGTWRARRFTAKNPEEGWHTEATDKPPWQDAQEVAAFGEAVNSADAAYKSIDVVVPPILLRKAFMLRKPIASAHLYATAAGVYEMQLNGKKVGKDFLTPGWTDYPKRIRYQTYDVTSSLRKGENVLGGIVASGWFSGRIGYGQNVWGFDKALFAQLIVNYQDGTQDVVATDCTWTGSSGPWRAADLLDGETYDAQREMPLWSSPTFAADSWRSVVVLAPKVGQLEAQIEPPIRNTLTLPAKKMTSPTPGVQIFDLGQNMVGWARFSFAAEKGTTVKFRWAEILNKDGTMFTDNLRSALATDRYVAARSGQQTYEPRFTFHGFRYVEVSGHKGTLPLAAVTGVVLQSDLPLTGNFQTSNAMLNQLQSNIVWGQRGNFLSIPTDCPQRDERLGWSGDINMFALTATHNMDVSTFLAKYLVDVQDGQRADGAFPDVAPSVSTLGFGSFGWGDVGVFLPWLLYQTYGDLRVLERHYESARRWVDYRTSRAKDDLNTDDSFGDWVSPPPQTPNKVLSPMYHAQAAHVLANMARVLGKLDDTKRYDELTERIKVAFNKTFVAADGRITSDTQTAYAIALRFDMLPQDKRTLAKAHFVNSIQRFNNHLNTGFLGTGNLLPSLSLADSSALAYDLLMTDTFPSWLFTVKNGATTMWERWDSYSPQAGPNNVGDMNSYNHYAFGAVGEWMYAHIAGLQSDPEQPGWRKATVRPLLGGGLTSARAEYQSIRGRFVSAWKLDGHNFTLDVEIPAHATAKVFVPALSVDSVKEKLVSAAQSQSVVALGMQGDAAVFEVGSGQYHFTSTVAQAASSKTPPNLERVLIAP
jgi:alpha-L-rhamnosidase